MSAVPARRSSMAPAVTAPDPAAAPALKARRSTQTYGLPTQRDRLVAAAGSWRPSSARRRSASTTSASGRASRAAPSMSSTPTAKRASSMCTRRPSAGWWAMSAEAVADGRGRVGGPCGRRRSKRCCRPGTPTESLAHLCVVSAAGGSDETMALRRMAVSQLAGMLAGAPAQPLAAEPVLAGALGSVWELALPQP